MKKVIQFRNCPRIFLLLLLRIRSAFTCEYTCWRWWWQGTNAGIRSPPSIHHEGFRIFNFAPFCVWQNTLQFCRKECWLSSLRLWLRFMYMYGGKAHSSCCRIREYVEQETAKAIDVRHEENWFFSCSDTHTLEWCCVDFSQLTSVSSRASPASREFCLWWKIRI